MALSFLLSMLLSGQSVDTINTQTTDCFNIKDYEEKTWRKKLTIMEH